MATSPLTQAVLSRLKEGGRVIGIVSAPAPRLGDARALILLSQVIYRTSKDPAVARADGWICKPANDWMAETCLTRSHLASAVATLQGHGLIKVWRNAKQAPWWKLDLARLYEFNLGRQPTSALTLQRFQDQATRERIVGKALPYYTLLAEAVEDALGGFFLSRCVYWQALLEERNRLTNVTPTWGWSSPDWTKDIGITRSQLRTVMRQLAKQGFITLTEIGRPFPGIFVHMKHLGIAIKAISMPEEEVPKLKAPELSSKAVDILASSQSGVLSTPVKAVQKFPTYQVWTPKSAPLCTPCNAEIKFSLCTVCTTNPTQPFAGNDRPASPVVAGNAQPTAENDHSNAGFSQPIAGFSQSTRAHGFDSFELIETTTTPPFTGVHIPPTPENPVVVVQVQDTRKAEAPAEPDWLQSLHFPKLGLYFTEADLRTVKAHIATALPHRRQCLLDELTGKLQDAPGFIKNPSAWLGALIRRDNAATGQCLLDYAGKVAARRDRDAQRAAHLGLTESQPQQPVAAPAPKPDFQRSEATAQAWRQALSLVGRRQQETEENEQ